MAQLHFSRYHVHAKYSHYLFRFPAKFHPPAVRCLLDRYSSPGSNVLDPFCGSGTLLVEALLSGRHATGVDVDPLAAFIARVKCRPLEPTRLERAFDALRAAIDSVRRTDSEYDRLMHDDFDPSAISRFGHRFSIPLIPNIDHWFRTYVVLDLARLRQLIQTETSGHFRSFFLACFASIIRNASNADPVPVSGLEVTQYMRKLDAAGRRIDPFQLFEQRVTRELRGMAELWKNASRASIRVRRGDATAMARLLPEEGYDLVLTSPPYNTAVDYYRRHMLEMYWLGLVSTHEERLALRERYVGRIGVRLSNSRLRSRFTSNYVQQLIEHAEAISPARERNVRHYCASIQQALRQIARVLKPKGTAVFVVGNAKWNGRRVRATHLIRELARECFHEIEQLSYPARNRYMSYHRHNGADVNREFVLALRKRQ